MTEHADTPTETARRVIYKYPIYVTGTIVSVPSDSRILKIEVQDNEAYAWIEQDPDPTRLVVNIHFTVVATGIPFDNDNRFNYIDSFLLYDGGFVGHVYARFE